VLSACSSSGSGGTLGGTGGAGTGGAATGGADGSGGSSAGGGTGAGGAKSSGGSTASGGSAGTGGSTASGGSAGTGGSTASGGFAGSGGSTASGGSAGSDASTATRAFPVGGIWSESGSPTFDLTSTGTALTFREIRISSAPTSWYSAQLHNLVHVGDPWVKDIVPNGTMWSGSVLWKSGTTSTGVTEVRYSPDSTLDVNAAGTEIYVTSTSPFSGNSGSLTLYLISPPPPCDGPEDCTGGTICCANIMSKWPPADGGCEWDVSSTACAATCGEQHPDCGPATLRPCHTSADCTGINKDCCELSSGTSTARLCTTAAAYPNARNCL
jgi:hypothetical protein